MSEEPFQAPNIDELEGLFTGYQFQSLIALGGMGAVYKAIQISLEREVAVKVLPRKYGDNQEFCAQFETEAKAMARMNHENLLSVIDFGNADGLLYIVMEYVGGGSLHDAVFNIDLSVSNKLEIVMRTAMGITHAHEKGMIHRDIKPANILLDDKLSVKVADFGLAREEEGEKDSVIWGTPGYTAPEVMTGPNMESVQSDIYSLGGVLYFIFFVKDPDPEGLTLEKLVHIDRGIAAIIMSCMDMDPARRYTNANELVEDLQNLLAEMNANPAGNLSRNLIVNASGSVPVVTIATTSPSGTTSLKTTAPASASNNAFNNMFVPTELKSKKSGSLGLIVCILILIGCVIGGYYFINEKTEKEKVELSQPASVVDYTPKVIELQNPSFETYEKVSEQGQAVLFAGWENVMNEQDSMVRIRSPKEGTHESITAFITNAEIYHITNHTVTKGRQYILEFSLGKINTSKLIPQRDFKVDLMINGTTLRTMKEADMDEPWGEPRTMQNFIIRFNTQFDSLQFAEGPLKIRFLSGYRGIYIDDVKLSYRPLLPAEL